MRSNEASGVEKCMICGREFHWLPPHLRVHKVSAEEYKKKYPGAKIMSDAYQQKHLQFRHSEETKEKISLSELQGSGQRILLVEDEAGIREFTLSGGNALKVSQGNARFLSHSGV